MKIIYATSLVITHLFLQSSSFAVDDNAPDPQQAMVNNLSQTSSLVKSQLNTAVNLVDAEYGGRKLIAKPVAPVLTDETHTTIARIEPDMKFFDPEAFYMLNNKDETALIAEVLASAKKSIKVDRLFDLKKSGGITKVKPLIKVSSIIENDGKDWVAFINGKRFNTNKPGTSIFNIVQISNDVLTLVITLNDDVIDKIQSHPTAYPKYIISKDGTIKVDMNIGSCIFSDDLKITFECSPRPIKKIS